MNLYDFLESLSNAGFNKIGRHTWRKDNRILIINIRKTGFFVLQVEV